MKVYILYDVFKKDVKRKNSEKFSSRIGDMRLIKSYSNKSIAEEKLRDYNNKHYDSTHGFADFKLEEVEVK